MKRKRKQALRRCKGTTKLGLRCNLEPRRGSDYCRNHMKQEESIRLTVEPVEGSDHA